MSKSTREGLFGITLTELVIILFFIMLLLAIFNIEKINEELVETQKLVPDSTEDVIAKSTIVEILFPDGEITSDLVPVKEIEDKIKELQKAQDEFQKIADESIEGSGDCGEGGAWTDPQCADYCWEIDSTETQRKYDYLVDIGICRSSVVVQRSEWIKKSEPDFVLVNGALQMVNENVMRSSDLYQYLDMVKEPGYSKEPKQCAHWVRLVDLDAGSIPRWQTIGKEISTRVGSFVLTSNDSSYESVKSRFPQNICNDITPTKASVKQQEETIKLDDIPMNKSSNSILPEIENSLVNSPAELNFPSFIDAFRDECSSSRRAIRNNNIVLKYEISLTADGEVLTIKSLNEEELSNSNLRRLNSLAVDSLKKSVFLPKYNNGEKVPTTFTTQIPFGANACT